MIVSPARTRVLLALIAVYQRDGRATVRTVADEAGLFSPNTAHRHLVALRDLGLVWWDPDHRGTLRPAVAVVSNVSSTATTLGENRSGGRAAQTADPRGQHPAQGGVGSERR